MNEVTKTDGRRESDGREAKRPPVDTGRLDRQDGQPGRVNEVGRRGREKAGDASRVHSEGRWLTQPAALPVLTALHLLTVLRPDDVIDGHVTSMMVSPPRWLHC